MWRETSQLENKGVTKKKYPGKKIVEIQWIFERKKCETKNREHYANKTENKANTSEKKETCSLRNCESRNCVKTATKRLIKKTVRERD